MPSELLQAYQERAKADLPRLQGCKNWFAGRTVYCVGNGPSLLKQDPDKLSAFVSTNRGCEWLKRAGPTIVTDAGRFLENRKWLLNECFPIFVAPHLLCDQWWNTVKDEPRFICLPVRHNPVMFKISTSIGQRLGHPFTYTDGSDFDLEDHVDIAGYSVIFPAIQLAYYMGAKTIALVGVDMDWSGPKKHFSHKIKPYNIAWGYERHRPAMIAHRDGLAARGVKLVNATAGGAVEDLERVSL